MKRIFVVLVTLFALSNTGMTQVQWGDVAPDFRLPALFGNPADSVSLSDYAGSVVFLNFFGYSCTICRADRAATEEIYQQFLGEDFQTLGIDVWNGSPTVVNAFFRLNLGVPVVTYPLLLYGGLNGVNTNYGMIGPLHDRGHVIVDKNGIVRWYNDVNDFDASIQSITDTITHYLAQPYCADVPLLPPSDVVIVHDWPMKLAWTALPCVDFYQVTSSVTTDFTDEVVLGITLDNWFYLPDSTEEIKSFRVYSVRE